MRVEELSDAELAMRPHRVRGPVARALLDCGAIVPARAVAYAPDGADAQRDLERARRLGLVKWTTDGRCWYDLRAFYAVQARTERTRVMIAIPLALIVAAVAVSFYPA
ncbi:hypothetical protein [Sphingomonas dokdonensis]|uniref:Uncharacterized protein n=1 Tax=Sphingomonas dokdonensis TaxID=344880 RepID=A0A245ZDI7_9SPHN|nr:hypothetical protein [Sphingomonas dokdonensis]OWK27760.1 hypothetical protein SPDO_31240 [Sphingomonas dokdonensis]